MDSFKLALGWSKSSYISSCFREDRTAIGGTDHGPEHEICVENERQDQSWTVCPVRTAAIRHMIDIAAPAISMTANMRNVPRYPDIPMMPVTTETTSAETA